MAARDRFGVEPNLSQLQRYIRKRDKEIQSLGSLGSADFWHTERAFDPSNYESNLALNLEIADIINQKKGNA